MDPLNVTIVALLVGLVVLIEWADRRNLVARWFDRVRVRYGRRIPTGGHRVDGPVGIHFGQDDATLILTIPIRWPGLQRPTKYVGATDGQTKFTVEGVDASPDELLAAYDDSLGPLTILVHGPGRIVELGIASVDRTP